jgi:outer membrane protein OmpA-like peptidoglycan-associated protein
VRTKGWGKSKPITANTKSDGSDDPDGRAKNRRVEIIVTRQ